MLSDKKKLAILLSCIFAVVIGLAATAAMLLGPGLLPVDNKPDSSSQSESLSEEESQPSQDGESQAEEAGEGEETIAPPPTFNKPQEMLAAVVTPGVDFLAQKSQEQATTKAEIDTMLDKLVALALNTVVVDTSAEGFVIYKTESLPTAAGSFDPMSYLVTRAREKGLYVYAIYDALLVGEGDRMGAPAYVDAAMLGLVEKGIRSFAQQYPVDGVLLESYANPTKDTSYAGYLKAGGTLGFENYMRQVPEKVVHLVSDTMRESAPGVQLGLVTPAVWSNATEANPAGSQTTAATTQLDTDNADGKAFVEEGLVDFVAVEAYGSLTDGAAPFKTVVDWWAKLAQKADIPLYTLQASDRICSDNAGWGAADQITKQIIAAREIGGYSGSIFNSYSRLTQNPSGATDLMVKYLNEEVTADYILTELTMAKPAKTTFETTEPQVVFTGASDANEKVTINDEAIQQDKNGFFAQTYPLEVGLNTFTIVHKAKTITYNITRKVDVLKEVSPASTVNVAGGMQIRVSAKAYDGATVTATLGGQTITLTQEQVEDDDTDKDSSYSLYSGSFTAPSATTSDQQIGKVSIAGTYEGQTATMTGGAVIVNKKMELADGVAVMITADEAETFPIDTLNDKSDPTFLPICQGALDYTVSDELVYNAVVTDDGKTVERTFSYYLLASGRRVYAKDITPTSEEPGGNKISGMTITADEQYTNVVLKTVQKVSYTATYSSGAITIEFHSTDAVPKSIESLSKNPLFTSATWSGTTLKLTLRVTNGFLGYKAYFDSNGNLVFRFNNPPTSGLNGARIVVDPGHGGKDPGAISFNSSYPEAYINYHIASRLADVLSGYGASAVVLTRGQNGSPSLSERVAAGKSNNANLFVSIHNNSSSNGIMGTEVYYFNPFSKSLAAGVSSQVSSALDNGNNRGGKFGYYYVTRTARFPSILAECGFITNEEEYDNLMDDGYQQAVAEGIADAIAGYYDAVGGGTVMTGSQSSGESVDVGGGGDDESTGEAPEAEDESGDADVDGVSLGDEVLELAVGDTHSLKATVSPSDAANKKVTWESSDTAVASVDSAGKIKAKKEGTAVITVTTKDGEYTAQCEVTVGKAAAGKAIYLDQEEITISVDEEYQIYAYDEETGDDAKSITWTSSRTGVAKVDSSGNITGLKAGTTTITAATKDGKHKATCKIRVEE